MVDPVDRSVPVRLVIGIPTFKRPRQLATLLDSLAAELKVSRRAREGGVKVIVADNASDAATGKIVREHLRGVPHTVVGVATPGISAVRNALVRTAGRECPDWRWLVMVDDDGVILSPWLDPLLDAGERFDADVVGGPVVGDLPSGASRLARNSLFASLPRFPTGRVAMLNGAQNLAIRRRIAERVGDPWFRLELGLSGGEDYEFFRRCVAEGAVLAWCDEAPMLEPTPAERLETAALVKRIFRANAVAAGIDHEYDGAVPGWRKVALWCTYPVRIAGKGVLTGDVDRLYTAVLRTVSVAGRAAGLVRCSTAEARSALRGATHPHQASIGGRGRTVTKSN